MIEQVDRKIPNDVLRCWLDLPTHHGGIHDVYMWNSRFNVGVHCVDVAMGIGTLVYW
jgi:hypothetical protein